MKWVATLTKADIKVWYWKVIYGPLDKSKINLMEVDNTLNAKKEYSK